MGTDSVNEFYQETRHKIVRRMDLFQYKESCNINDAFVYKGMLECLKCLDEAYEERKEKKDEV